MKLEKNFNCLTYLIIYRAHDPNLTKVKWSSDSNFKASVRRELQHLPASTKKVKLLSSNERKQSLKQIYSVEKE